jgi:FtsP/CotA-like multicopper oxidase with cupredoxin domain
MTAFKSQPRQLDIRRRKWSGFGMTQPPSPPSRRTVLTGLSGLALAPILPAVSLGQARTAITLQARPDSIPLKGDLPSALWALQPADPAQPGPLRFRRGDEPEIRLDNRLPVPIALACKGLAGVPAAETLLGAKALAAGDQAMLRLPLRHAGTALWDARLLGDGQALPLRPLAVIVAETEPVTVDRDEVLLIEDFRLRADGSLVAPGSDAGDAAVLFTVNGRPAVDLVLRINERLRLRLINGCHRAVIAMKLGELAVRVMAIDGQPSEPFPARNSQLVLAPGTRLDVFIDGTSPSGARTDILLHDGKQPRPIGRLTMSGDTAVRDKPLPPAAPLPSNGLPDRLDLKSALRIDMPLSAPAPEWSRPAELTASTPPAFRTKPGRTVVLALTNRATSAAVFHIHGHHVRLLDRLDDGWKPFWLDTLALDPGQTQRVAFAADNVGRWLLEAFIADWAAPRQVRWYGVD